MLLATAAMAAQASSSFPMLAHNNFLVVLSLQVAATPFTHSILLALLAQSHLCLQTTLWLLVAVAVVVHFGHLQQTVLAVAAQAACCQALV
jgi:hypothetical protein